MAVVFSAAPMRAFAWSQPDLDLANPRFSIQVEWQWPTQAYWSRFRLVRSVRSPCARIEEGWVVLDTTPDSHGEYADEDGLTPTFRDGERYGTGQPDPGEWVFYTAFVLDANRIWKPAGHVHEISPDNAGWSARLPDLLPGNATALDRGVMHPPDQASDVVQFLQGPAAFLDMVVSKGEAAQYFWDPLKAPPQAVPHIARSWGYPYSNLIGLGRNREVLAALRTPSQGSTAAINRLASAASGCSTFTSISNNLFLDVNDSSFEGGDVNTTRWTPKTKITVRDLAQIPGTVVVPPNVQVQYCLHVTAATTFYCGSDSPITKGIPIQDWTHVRTGLYGMDVTEGGTNLLCDVDMGMDVYDKDGVYLQRFTTMTPKRLTGSWAAYGFSDPQNMDDYGNRVPLTIGSQEVMPADVLTNAANWSYSAATNYANPQSTAPVPVAGPGMRLAWTASPTTDGLYAMWGVDAQKQAILVWPGAVYQISVRVNAAAGAAQWRASAGGNIAYGTTVTPDGTSQISSFLWKSTTSSALFGVEVLKPGGGWSAAGTHTVEAISVTRQNPVAVYGVPWIHTTNPCYLDLIVVDDGR